MLLWGKWKCMLGQSTCPLRNNRLAVAGFRTYCPTALGAHFFLWSGTNKKSIHSDDTHSSTKLKTIVLVMSLKDTPVRQRMLCMTFWVYVRTIQRLNYSGQEHTRHTCDLETRSRSSNLVQLLDTKQGYNNAKFEKRRLNSVRVRANEKVSGKRSQLSPLNMCKS